MNVRVIRALLAAMAALPAMTLAQGADDARPISLVDAVRLAQKNQPATVAARNAIRTGESAVRMQLMQFLPNLSLSTQANQREGTQLIQGVPLPLTGNPWSYNRSVSTNLTLFDGGRNYYNYKTSLANLDVFAAAEVTQRYIVALSVKTTYYTVLAAREAQAASVRQLEQADQQLKVNVTMMTAGVKTRSDSLSAAIAVGNARLAILNADNLLRAGNALLTRLVATPFTVTAIAADTAEVGRIDIGEPELVAMALDGPSVRSFAASLQANKSSHAANTTTYWPLVSISGSYGQTPLTSKTFNWGGGPTSTSSSLGFVLSYNIFDRYQRENTLTVARVQEENADANLRDAKFAAQQSLITLLNNYRTAMQGIELQQLQLVFAQENLRVISQQFSIGTKQLLDVLTAQTALDVARGGLITQRLNARIAKAGIEALIGRDIP